MSEAEVEAVVRDALKTTLNVDSLPATASPCTCSHLLLWSGDRHAICTRCGRAVVR
jgi:hypothetical protein